MRRVAVIGNAGSGKSTLAAELAARLEVGHVELDAIYHRENWTPLPDAAFRAQASARLDPSDGWVADGNYRVVRDLTWGRADTLVWLDLPRRIVIPRIVRRSVGRALRGTELWNGNRERLSELARPDPARSVIAWSVCQHAAYRAEYAAVPADPAWAHLRFVRLRSPADVRGWLALAAPLDCIRR